MGTSRAFAHSDIADVRYATVRYMIATNVNLADILTFLSDDIDDKVRRAVACNLNTPIPACQKLTKDANQTVSYWAWLRFTYTIY